MEHFQFLAIMNKVALNIHFLKYMFPFLLGKYQKVGQLDHR